jgi:hypothetical protein
MVKTFKGSDRELTSYEISLNECPYCAQKLQMSTMSSDLRRCVEQLMIISKVHLRKCGADLSKRKKAIVKVKTTIEKKEYTSISSKDNLIII